MVTPIHDWVPGTVSLSYIMIWTQTLALSHRESYCCYSQVCGTHLDTNNRQYQGTLIFIGTLSYKHSHTVASRHAVTWHSDNCWDFYITRTKSRCHQGNDITQGHMATIIPSYTVTEKLPRIFTIQIDNHTNSYTDTPSKTHTLSSGVQAMQLTAMVWIFVYPHNSYIETQPKWQY